MALIVIAVVILSVVFSAVFTVMVTGSGHQANASQSNDRQH
jgi:flagellar basal body-associated protein FliL